MKNRKRKKEKAVMLIIQKIRKMLNNFLKIKMKTKNEQSHNQKKSKKILKVQTLLEKINNLLRWHSKLLHILSNPCLYYKNRKK